LLAAFSARRCTPKLILHVSIRARARARKPQSVLQTRRMTSPCRTIGYTLHVRSSGVHSRQGRRIPPHRPIVADKPSNHPARRPLRTGEASSLPDELRWAHSLLPAPGRTGREGLAVRAAWGSSSHPVWPSRQSTCLLGRCARTLDHAEPPPTPQVSVGPEGRMGPDAAYWITHLGLSPHPEGGYFVETYRSSEAMPARALPSRYSGSRAFSSAIYFLLAGGDFSAFHRLRSDEIWHSYAGCGLALFVIGQSGHLTVHNLDARPRGGARPQVMIPSGSWLAAKPLVRDSYALVGCTVAPGFEFADFELGDRAALISQFPMHRALIESLTRSVGQS